MSDQRSEQFYTERYQAMLPFIRWISRGDGDRRQDATLGILETLQQYPTAPNRMLQMRAQWKIMQMMKRGRSIDILVQTDRQHPVSVLYYDQHAEDSDELESILRDRLAMPVDEQALTRIAFERFFSKLSALERWYVKLRMEGYKDKQIIERFKTAATRSGDKKKVKIYRQKLVSLCESARLKFAEAFGV